MSKDKNTSSADADELRRRAEEKLKATGAEAHQSLTESDTLRLVHELQVHQIELELQNDELQQARDDADASLELYTDLYDSSPLGYFTLDRQGNIRQVNLTGASLLRVERSRLVNGNFGLFVSPETRPAFNAFLESVFESQTKQICEVVMQTEAGAPIYVRIEATVSKDGEECRIAVVDITERRQAEEQIKSLARIPCENPNPILRISDDEVLLYANPAAEPLMQSLDGAVGSVAPPLWRDMAATARENHTVHYTESEHNDITYAYYVVSVSESGYVNLYAVNITERKQAEHRQQLSAEILGILNEPGALPDVINRILTAIKRETRFDAVGLRLQSGEDFPYFAQYGFSDDFLLTEKTLAVPGPEGDVCRDEDGNIFLGCTCGLVLSGKTDPTSPLYTSGGSCWTNNSLPILDIPPDQDPRLHPRNRCIHEGFLSIAIIPIRANNKIVGLLQLNDHKKDRLTSELVQYFEEVCGNIGRLLMQKQAEEALTRSNEQVVRVLESISDAFFALDKNWRFTYMNNEAEHLLLKSREELIGTRIWDQFPEAVGTLFQTEYERAMLEGAVVQFESYYPPFDKWFEVRAYPYENGLSVYFQDCSERQAAQDILARESERSAHIADVLQQTLIPPQMPIQPEGYEIAAKYQPALSEAEVCGDFYDLIDLGDGKLGIVIGDMLGKGLPAAARVAAVRHTIRSYAFLYDQPSRVMTLVSNALFRDITTENDMLTAFFAVLDTRTGRMAYTNAGHEPPLVRHSDGSVEPLAMGGPMFDGLGRHVYSEDSLSFQAGDLLVLVTDGITEARKGHGSKLFGTEGIIRCLSRNANASAEDIASKLLEDATAFANGTLHDDVALVVIRKVDACRSQ